MSTHYPLSFKATAADLSFRECLFFLIRYFLLYLITYFSNQPPLKTETSQKILQLNTGHQVYHKYLAICGNETLNGVIKLQQWE